jgi:hypothetical protein
MFSIAIVLVASPLYSQDLGDLGGFLGGDVGGLLNIAAPRGDARGGDRGAAPRGAAPAGGNRGPAAAPADRLAGLRQMFAGANMPLTAEQEMALNSLLNAAVPAMRQALQARILELQKARSAAATPAPAVPAGVAPAGPRGQPASLVSPDELLPELVRMNDQLVGKIADSPALSPDQQRFVRKALNDQIRLRGGFDALNLKMEEGGAPFTAEQRPQIQALFNEQEQLRAQMLKELQGQPADPAKVAQLERDTLLKVLRLLNPAQRAALNAPAAPAPATANPSR